MALPADVTTYRLEFGPYYTASGAVAFAGMTGKIKPSRSPVLHTDGSVLVNEPVRVVIDETGAASVELVHNDFGGGFTYSMEWDAPQRKPSPGNLSAFFVPSSVTVQDYDELAESEDVPGIAVPIGVGPAGPPGPQGDPGVADDASVAALVGDTGTATGGALRAAFVRRGSEPPRSLLRAPAPSTPTIYAGDDFAGTAGATLAGRTSNLGTASTWTVNGGTWQLDGAGHVSPTTAADDLIARLTLPATASKTTYTVSMDVVISKSGSASNQGALVFRYFDALNYWYFNPPFVGGTDWRLYRVVNGTHTSVYQFGMTKANGAVVNVRADVWGRDITLFLDGVEIYTIADATGQGAGSVGMRQGISGGYTTPCVFSNFKVTAYAGQKFNVPRFDADTSEQVVGLGSTGSFDDADCNNPNVVWDPANSRWVLYYSGFKAGTPAPTKQGMGIAYANTLEGPWTKDPANPVVAATTGNIENGGLAYHAGRWIKVEDLGGWFTSPDLHTWTPLTVYGLPASGTIGDPILRVNDSGLLELWWGVNVPGTQIWRATSSDGGVTWNAPAAPIITVPAWLTLRGHGEPSVYVPPGKGGQEAMVLVDVIQGSSGTSAITAVITVDGGATWHWHRIVGGSGSGFDAFQIFDSFPVFDSGVLHLFFAGSPVSGGEVNLQATIGHRAVQWTPTPDPLDPHPVPYQ